MFKIKILLLSFIFIAQLKAQDIESPSYDLDFLAAKYIDTLRTKQIVLLFKYQPKPDKEFKPIISFKLSYKIGDKKERTELFGESKHSITFYDRKIKFKNPELYQLISDKMDPEQKEEYGIIVIYLNDLTNKYVSEMDFKYGLWEPEDQNIRYEKNYHIEISK